MRVAITGGRGFIGSLLVKHHLQRGDDVRLLTRKAESFRDDNSTQLEIHNADLTDQSSGLNNFVDGVDVLYHCAGELLHQNLMNRTNVDGTKNLVTVATGRIGRWVQLSSVGVYGQHLAGDISEDSELCPVGLYETTQLQSDILVIEAGERKYFPWIILRPSTVYGSTMTNQSLFQLIEKVNRRQFFFIGKTGASLNYIHVDNVIDALFLCATCQSRSVGNIYNVSDHCSIEEFINMITSNLGLANITLRLPEWPIRRITSLLENIPGFPLTTSRIDVLTNRVIYPTTKIQNELGYHSVVSMEEGIQQIVNAWKEKQ